MAFNFPGRNESFVHDLASGYTVAPDEVEHDDFDRIRLERKLTQQAIASHQITESPKRERGLYEDLTISDRSRSSAQKRVIGGMPPWRQL